MSEPQVGLPMWPFVVVAGFVLLGVGLFALGIGGSCLLGFLSAFLST